MQPWNRLRILAFSLALVFFISAMAVHPVLADDSTPPPPAPSTGTISTAAAVTAADNSSITSVPHGTDVVVLDRSGRSVPLASQKAAHAVASGDPIWCPVGVAPKGNIGGCSPAFTTPGFSGIGGLGFWLAVNDPSKAGVIWIESGYNSSVNDSGMTSLTLDGSAGIFHLPNMANFSLTLKGGWSGISGSTVTNPAIPSMFDGSSLSIMNWNAPITISDIVVTSVTTNPNDTYALYVQTNKGGITLDRVQVIDNYTGHVGGAHLNTVGATLGHPAPVTVIDSSFNNNYYDGLYLQSDGAVNIHDLTADYNGGSIMGNGAYIDNYWDNPNQPVTLTGTNEFKDNAGDGLHINSYGAVTLNNITAFHNSFGLNGNGLYIDNAHDSTPSNVVLTGTNQFMYSGVDGLFILSNGNIVLNNITSTNNTAFGGYVNNCLNASSFDPCTTTGKSVTLMGTNSFNSNGADGLKVQSSGPISISQITANENTENGAYLDNCAYDGGSLCQNLLPYNVTLVNASTFIFDGGQGLFIHSTGTVSLKNITASFDTYGLGITNDANLHLPGSVVIGGTNVFNGNYYTGLDINSYGAITLSNVTANDNGVTGGGFGYGAYVVNDGYDSNAGGVGVNGTVLITRMPITLIGVNTFTDNKSGGLYAISAGPVTASNVTANSNGGDGAYLFNQDAWYPNFGSFKPYAANVTLSGFGFFNGNYNGLQVFSRGAVTLANLTANYSSVYGTLIVTKGDLAPQNVTISGVNTFFHNGVLSSLGDGLNVENDGLITISNITANNNTGSGAYLDNFTFAFPHKFLGVTLTGYNTFEENLGGYGLWVKTDGSAVVSHVNADENTNDGVVVEATKNVTLMCASAFNNFTGYGFYLTSGGTMTLIGVHDLYNNNNAFLSYITLHQTAACP
jgi:hypothetical protein